MAGPGERADPALNGAADGHRTRCLDLGRVALYQVSYSRMIDGLSKANILVNRKMLADLAVRDKEAFATLAKKALAAVK